MCEILFVYKGEFLGVIGTVGSGKSSLLAAILAELNKETGQIAIADVNKGFGFVSQQSWLQRGTIRENILFGKGYDETKYKSVINACCLADDLLLLPAGDLTGVGEGGTTLSGGQKARIALARAVYQDKSFYLLDDVIAAVDVNVAKHIFQHCLMGLLKNKTRILCTHHIQYLVNADRIALMENGTIKNIGKPTKVLKDIDDIIPIDLELGESIKSGATSIVESVTTESTPETDSILDEESRETGTINTSVYTSYIRAIGFFLFLCIIISIVIMQASRNMTDWWLSYWVSNANNNSTTNFTDGLPDKPFLSVSNPYFSLHYTMQHYMLIYLLLALANTLFTLFRAFLFAFGGLTAASCIHKSLLKVIMASKITFFDISPIGRIINRFSSDTYTVDDSLPFIMNILFAQLFGLIGTVIVIMCILPWLCSVLIPLIPIYHWLQNHYRLTSRELKRLSSVTLSPVYNHFNETLQGLATIRAMRNVSRFIRQNEEYVETSIKTQFASQAAAQWLGLRLQFIGVVVVTGVGLIAVIQHQYDLVDPGLVGLAITYSLSITGLLNGVINAFTETEREMIAVERVNQYIEEIVPETKDFIMAPPYAWPTQGVVTFTNVVLKYRDHLTPSLKSVSFETRPAEKIGVVGRTGAGKSSLFAGLFRLVELHSGEIAIDSVNIAHIALSSLRSRLFCIPQDPFLFSGTVKDNLDPLGEFRESEIWSALSRVDLTPTVKRLGGLDSEISSGGVNLSAGQRQLFCLARALLHNAKILCIDEATANVDHETDHQIQLALRSAFRKSTVIVIAHRVQTVLDCDRILVMGDGQILEFEAPDTLLADSSSTFYNLVNRE